MLRISCLTNGSSGSSSVQYFRLVALLILLLGVDLHALNAQTYAQSVGVPSFSASSPIESGFVNLANGNLHLEIPLASVGERAGKIDKVVLMYDSSFYDVINGIDWVPLNLSTSVLFPQGQGGWRVVTTGDSGTIAWDENDYGYCDDSDYEFAVLSPYFWTAPDGTQHSFPISTTTDFCGSGSVPNGSAYASDGSGYYMYITSVSNATVYAPDGTPFFVDAGVPLNYDAKSDPNGNRHTYYEGYSSVWPYPENEQRVYDNLNRTLADITTNTGNTEYYVAVPNEQGGTSTYTLKMGTVNAYTAFGYPNYDFNGSFEAVTEIDLPDGTTKYQFTYDSGTTAGHYGVIKSMTLPTGGVINYTFTEHADAAGSASLWLTKRTTPDSPTTGWNYSVPSVLSSCGSYGFYDYQNCQQQITVTKPTGDYAKYTFTLNGGAWPTLVQYYNSSSTLLASTSACYSFVTLSSGTCSYSLIGGTYPYPTPATNVYRTAVTTSLPVPSGTVSETTEYAWDPSDDGNLTEMKEWNFGSSLSGSADRTTDYTYYSSGQVINRPASITVTDSSSSLVAKTLNTYDCYSSPCSSLVTTGATGIVQHDDTNYGSGFTARGNLTQVKRYTGSSSYLPTETMTYDITGQMRTATDAYGNVSTFTYSDSFYTDTGDGSSPSAYYPSVSTNAFLTSVTLATSTSVAETTTDGYYWGTGQLAKSVDPNSQATFFHYYDSMDRPTSVSYPDSSWTKSAYASTETQIDTGASITSATPTTSCTGNACRQDETKLDGLARVIHQSLVNAPPGTSTVDTTYDADGRVATVSNPHLSGGSPTDGTETYGYDGLDRPSQITRTDGSGSVAHTYFGSDVTVSPHGGRSSQICSGYGVGFPVLTSDEAGNLTQRWTDGFGRLIEVDQPDSSTGSLTSGSPIGTCYKYDLNNNLTYVLQNSDRARTYTYDLASRLTSASFPETKGNTVYYYYTTSGSSLCAGDISAVCRKTDARSITTTYAYDQLNRLTTKSHSDSTPTVNYVFSGATLPSGCSVGSFSYGSMPVGRLTAMCDGAGSEAWRYAYVSGTGSSIADQRTTNSVTKTTTTTSNYDGSLATLAYPTGRTVTYTPTAGMGSVSAVDTSNSINYATSAAYGPTGQLSSLTNGSSLVSTLYFDKRLQPCRFSVKTSGTSPTSCSDSTDIGNIFDLTFNYNLASSDNGNVVGITNNITSTRSQSFSYDKWSQISQATGATYAASPTNCWGESYTVDAWGNLAAITPLTGSYSGCSQESGLSLVGDINSYNQITLSGFSYDSSGNMTQGPITADAYTYNAENQMTQAAVSSTVGYVYDGMGRRVEKTSSGTAYKLYWYDLNGNVIDETDGSGGTSSSTFSEYVFFNGSRISRRDSSANTFYYFTDHLGSVRRIVQSGSTSLCYDADFYPYGVERVITNTCSPTNKFTGKERDSESNLDDFMARFYNSGLGRMMSADPLGGSAGDPKSLNRYSYAYNNPLNVTDPTGMDGTCGIEGCGGPGCDGDSGCDGCDDMLFGCGGFPVNEPPIFRPPPQENDPETNVNPPSGELSADGATYGCEVDGIPCGMSLPGLNLSNLASLSGIHMPSLLVSDWTNQNGYIVGDYNGEPLCDSDGGSCQNLWWNASQSKWLGTQPPTPFRALVQGGMAFLHPFDMLTANAMIFAAGAGNYVASALLLAGGCLDGPVSPVTCGFSMAGSYVLLNTGTALMVGGGYFFKDVTAPAFKEWWQQF
jgi:RHS repeat-associated protein